MSSYFQPNFVIAEDNTLIALKFIAALKYQDDSGEEMVFDRLNNDRKLVVITCYGESYKISMKTQLEKFNGKYKVEQDIDNLSLSIYLKWLTFIQGQI